MTLSIEIPAETRRRLEERAGRMGQTIEAVALELIARGVEEPRSIDSILAPFRREVEASGITDEELDDLFESEREAIHREKRRS